MNNWTKEVKRLKDVGRKKSCKYNHKPQIYRSGGKGTGAGESGEETEIQAQDTGAEREDEGRMKGRKR